MKTRTTRRFFVHKLLSYTTRGGILSLTILFSVSFILPALSHAAVPGSLGAPIWTVTSPTIVGGGITAISGNYLYSAGTNIKNLVGGTWYVEKRNTDGTIDWSMEDTSSSIATVRGIAVGTNAVYVVGRTFIGASNYVIRIDKIDKNTGSLLATIVISPGPAPNDATASSVVADNASGMIYIGASNRLSGTSVQGMVYEIDQSSLAIIKKIVVNNTRVEALALDNTGIYFTTVSLPQPITGKIDLGVQKWGLHLSTFLWSSTHQFPYGDTPWPVSMITAGGKVYIVGGGQNFLTLPLQPHWQIQILDAGTGALLTNTSGSIGLALGTFSDGTNVYVVGTRFLETGSSLLTAVIVPEGWRIEKYPSGATVPSWFANYGNPSLLIGSGAANSAYVYSVGGNKSAGSPVHFYIQAQPVIPSTPPTPSISYTPSPTWSCSGTGVTSVSLKKGSGSGASAVSYAITSPSSGTLPADNPGGTWTPTGAGTYTLTCTNPGGTSAPQSVTIPSTTASLSFSPQPTVTSSASTPLGAAKTLYWWSNTTANTCKIGTASGGSNIVSSGADSGSTTVSPSVNTTYYLTCTGPGGTATQSASLSISAPPTPSISYTPSPSPGSVSWSCNGNGANLTKVKVVGPTGGTLVNTSPGTQTASGSFAPSTTGSYTLTCTTPNGTQTQTTSVILSGTLTAFPTMVNKGVTTNATFQWSISGISSLAGHICTISGPGFSSPPSLSSLTGSTARSIKLSHQAIYDLTCDGTSILTKPTLINLVPQYSPF